MSQPRKGERRLIRLLTVVAIGFGCLFILQQSERIVSRFENMTDDFTAYWSAGRANLTGRNPYDLEQLLAIQKAAGWPRETTPYLFRYPPTALTPFMLLGLLPYPLARLTWLVFSLIILLISSLLLWKSCQGDRQRSWLALAIAGSFAPTMLAIAEGQPTPLMVLGIAIFLLCEQRNNWLLAGVTTVLFASKPQILYLFGIALLLWSVTQRRWRLIGGAALALGIATWLPTLTNPAVLSQYMHDVWRYQETHWYSMSAIGTGLRLLFGPDKQWLQFLPMIVGLSWLAIYWAKLKTAWDWSICLPYLTLLSVLTAPSAWIHDQAVFLIAVLAAFTKIPRLASKSTRISAVAMFVVINAIGWIAFNLLRFEQIWFFWMPGAFLVWYWFIERGTRTGSVGDRPEREIRDGSEQAELLQRPGKPQTGGG